MLQQHLKLQRNFHEYHYHNQIHEQDCLLKNVSALSGSTGTQCLLLYCEY